MAGFGDLVLPWMSKGSLMAIDVKFDVYSDTPAGKDPDSYSRTLRRYHQLLWSKRLPSGAEFRLSVENPKAYLHHSSELGEFRLSSDSIGHTYRNVKSMAAIVADISFDEMVRFFSVCSTVGAYIVFPSQRIDGKPTINGARGLSARIKDRFDLTLECIRLHYLGQPNPLDGALSRYPQFFELFESFQGYVDFFLLHDLVTRDAAAVEFFLPFRGFDASPLPTNVEEYRSYRDKVVGFVRCRNRRIEANSLLI